MITAGSLPDPHVVVIRVGPESGRFIPVVGSLYRPAQQPVHFAGAGEMKDDKVHFAPESWDSKPMTLHSAIQAARDKAAIEDWVDVVLPKDLS